MKPVKPDVSFPALEAGVLKFWNEHGLVRKGLEANKGKEAFVFYDGPPFATGLPHYGHLLAGTLKDIVPRYWAMKGFYVERRWGWDCHGLPVEFEMENELGLSGRHDIEAYGVDKFNEACRGIVQRYTREWQQIVERTGRWVDFENQYRTMDTSFMESVWWAFKQLWDKGLIFEGYRVMPYSWRITTPLSNFEAGLNYRDVQDPALTVRFTSRKQKNRYFLAWTTTPWTLVSNLGLAVHPEIRYVEVVDKQSADHYVLAKNLVGNYYRSPDEYQVLKEMPGTELEGERYEPLFPYFKDREAAGAFRVMLGDFVVTTEGTGIVHMAPAFGEDDFELCRRNGIELVDPVDREGKFTALIPEYTGQFVKDADKAIIKELKSKGRIVKQATVTHSYPFCWRSDTPLIYKAISTWFVKLDPIKPKLINNNKLTHWVPEHLRDGRFGNWLENARDWNISRNRFWGTPMPVWRCTKECGGMICVGSISELEQLSGRKLADIHKHFVDAVTVPCPKCRKPMSRIEEVLDCWFESGSMPYGQNHYPFENKEKFDRNFPADFIAEGVDQTRGWFYTLFVLASALFDKPPFKNVIVNGLVLAEDGKKMSKRLKNYPDPVYVLDTYGADALRAYLTSSPASHADDLCFSEAGVKEVVRSVLLPFWNAYSFFVTYAIADSWTTDDFKGESLSHLDNELDRWILSRLQSLIRSVDEKMEVYHLYEVVPRVLHFIDDLTNWYIRLNRRRFWEEKKSDDKNAAYATLYFILKDFCKILAPILPFVTEEAYQNLRLKGDSDSVHLSEFPKVREEWIARELENQMQLVQSVVVLGRSIRSSSRIKTRQPLKEVRVITRDPADQRAIERYGSIISQELNVKKISFTTDEAKWVLLAAKANAKVLGPRLGSKMKLVLERVQELSPDEVSRIESEGGVNIDGEWIKLDEILIQRQPKQKGAIQTQGELTVWIDTELDDDLVAEGRAREIVNRIQKLRKDMNLEVTDRIRLAYESADELRSVFERFHSYIAAETLAEEIVFKNPGQPWTAEQEIDRYPLKVLVEKA